MKKSEKRTAEQVSQRIIEALFKLLEVALIEIHHWRLKRSVAYFDQIDSKRRSWEEESIPPPLEPALHSFSPFPT